MPSDSHDQWLLIQRLIIGNQLDFCALPRCAINTCRATTSTRVCSSIAFIPHRSVLRVCGDRWTRTPHPQDICTMVHILRGHPTSLINAPFLTNLIYFIIKCPALAGALTETAKNIAIPYTLCFANQLNYAFVISQTV